MERAIGQERDIRLEAGKRIEFEKLINTRDLGGFCGAGGKSIRPGLLLRSGELYPASEADLLCLSKNYRLRAIVDFRTPMEQRKKPDPAVAGAVHIANPILDEATMGITHEKEDCGSPEKEETGSPEKEECGSSEKDWLDVMIGLATVIADAPGDYMERMYRNLALTPFAREQYGRFLKLLAAGCGDGAILWHCTAGKDRVGVGTAFLLSVLGVDRQAIVDDYMKTNEYYRERNDKMEAEAGRRTKNAVVAASVRGLYSVRESYIRSVFRAIEDEYGTVNRYLADGLFVTEKERDQIRKLYLC